MKCGNETILKENLENAEREKTDLHKTVDTLIDSHVDYMKAHGTKLDDKINIEDWKLHDDETVLLKMFETFEKTTMVGLDLIEHYEKMKTTADNLKTLELSQYRNKQVYVKGQVDRESLNEIIGKVGEIKPSINIVEMISSFYHLEKVVHTIVPISSIKVWLIYKNTGKFRFLDENGRHIKSVKRDASGLSFIPQDDGFLCCSHHKKNILNIDMSGKSSVWMDTSPLQATNIGEALNS